MTGKEYTIARRPPRQRSPYTEAHVARLGPNAIWQARLHTLNKTPSSPSERCGTSLAVAKTSSKPNEQR